MKPYDPAKYAHHIAGELYSGMEPSDQWAQRIEDCLRAAYRAGSEGRPLVVALPYRTVLDLCPYCRAEPFQPCRSSKDDNDQVDS